MVERRRGGNEQERDETARLIVQAARRLFMAHGYRAVSTRQVAEAVGLTQPALYHHFATKEELYVAVALGEVARLRGGIERLARREGAVRERLHGIARFMLTTVDYDFPQMYHDMGAELGEKSRATLGAAFFGGVIAPLAALFAEGQAAGNLRDEAQGALSPAGAAGLFMAFVAHFLDRPLVGERATIPGGVDASATLLIDLLFNGLAVKPGADPSAAGEGDGEDDYRSFVASGKTAVSGDLKTGAERDRTRTSALQAAVLIRPLLPAHPKSTMYRYSG